MEEISLCGYPTGWCCQAMSIETAVSTLLYATLAVTVVAACTFPLGWVAMDGRECGLLALAACGFGLGIYSMTESQ